MSVRIYIYILFYTHNKNHLRRRHGNAVVHPLLLRSGQQSLLKPTGPQTIKNTDKKNRRNTLPETNRKSISAFPVKAIP